MLGPNLPAGHGTLAFAIRAGRTFVRSARAESPLKLVLPKNHGHAAWVTTATFGGGLVDGDHIDLDVDVGQGAAALLGTQASTKVYRCPSAACGQRLRARVGEGALLAVVPDPVACFAQARYEQHTHVVLGDGASVILLDALTSGRAARGERWDFHRYASRTTVEREGSLLLDDPLVLDPAHGDLHARMGRFDAFATLILAGPRIAPLLDAARALPPPARRAALVMSASPLGDDGLLVRIAGERVEDVTRAARARLEGLSSLLGDDPFARKW